jgi:hypothetical protein
MAQINQSSSGNANLNTSGGNGTGNQTAGITIGSASQAPVNARRLVADIVAQRLADDRKTRTLRDSMVPAHVTHADLGPARHFTNALNQAIAEINKFDDLCTKIGSHNAAQNTKIPFPSLDEKALTSHLLTMIDFNPPLDKKDLSVAGEKLFAVKYFIDFALQHETAPDRQEALKKTRRVYTAVIEHTMRHLPADAKKQFAKSQTDDHSKASLYHVIKDLSASEAKAVQKESKGLQRLLGLSDPESFKRKMGRNFEELGPPLPKHEQGPAIALATANAEKPNHQARGWQQLQTMLMGQGGNPATMPAPIGPPSRQRFEQQEWQLAKTLSTLAQGLPGMTTAMQQTVLGSIVQRIGDLTMPTRGLVLLDLLECNAPAFQNQIHRLANRNLDAIASAVPYMDKVQLGQAAGHLQRALAAVPPINPEHVLTCAFTLMGDAGRLSNAAKTNLYLQLPAILGRLDDLGTMAHPVQKNIMDMAKALIAANNALLTNNQGSALDNMVRKLFEVRDTLAPAIQGQVDMICAPYVERLLKPAVLATLPDNTKQAMIPLLKARLLQPRGQSVSALLKEIIGALPAYTLPHDTLWQPMWEMLGPNLKYLTGPHAGQAATQIPANLNALAAGQRDTALAKLTMALTRGSVPQPLKAAMIDCVTGQLSGAGTPMAQLPFAAAALAGTLKSIKEATLQLKIVNTFDTEIPKITDLNTRARIKASVAAVVPYLRSDDGKHALQKKVFNTALDKLDELKNADQEEILLPLAQRWRELGTSDMRKKMTAEIATRLPELATRDPKLVTTLCDSLNNAALPQNDRNKLACALIRNSNDLNNAAQDAISNATQTFLNTEKGLITLANDAFKADVPAAQQQTVFSIIRNKLGSLPLNDGPRRDLAIQLLALRDQLKDNALKTAVDTIAEPYIASWLLKIEELQSGQQATVVNAAVQRLVNSDTLATLKMALARAFTKIKQTDLESVIASIRACLQKDGNKDSDAAVLTWQALAHAIPELAPATTIGILKAIGPAIRDLSGGRRGAVLSTLGELWDELTDPDCKNALVDKFVGNVLTSFSDTTIPQDQRQKLLNQLSSMFGEIKEDPKQIGPVAACLIKDWKLLTLDKERTCTLIFDLVSDASSINDYPHDEMKSILKLHVDDLMNHWRWKAQWSSDKRYVMQYAVEKLKDSSVAQPEKVNMLKTLMLHFDTVETTTGAMDAVADFVKATLTEAQKLELFAVAVENHATSFPEYVDKFCIDDMATREKFADSLSRKAPRQFAQNFDKFKITDENKKIKLAKIVQAAQPNQFSKNIGKFAIASEEARFELAKSLMEKEGGIKMYVAALADYDIKDKSRVDEIVRLIADSDPLTLALNIRKFYSTEDDRAKAAEMIAKNAPDVLAKNFEHFGINDNERKVHFARLIADSSPESLAKHFKNFGIKQETDRVTFVEQLKDKDLSSLCKHFDQFDINDIGKKVEIAKHAESKMPDELAANFAKFKIAGKDGGDAFLQRFLDNHPKALCMNIEQFAIGRERLKELAGILATNQLSQHVFAENFRKFHVEDLDQRIKFAGIVAKNSPASLAEYFISFLRSSEAVGEKIRTALAWAIAADDNALTSLAENFYHFDIENEKERENLALRIADKAPVLAKRIERFHVKSKPVLLEIAKKLSILGGPDLAENFEEFKIVAEQDRIAIAKELANMPGSGLGRNFEKFKISEEADRIEIARLLAKNDPEALIGHLEHFQISERSARIELYAAAHKAQARTDKTIDRMGNFDRMTRDLKGTKSTNLNYQVLAKELGAHLDGDNGKKLVSWLDEILPKIKKTGEGPEEEIVLRNRAAIWWWYTALELQQKNIDVKQHWEKIVNVLKAIVDSRPHENRYKYTDLFVKNCFDDQGNPTEAFRDFEQILNKGHLHLLPILVTSTFPKAPNQIIKEQVAATLTCRARYRDKPFRTSIVDLLRELIEDKVFSAEQKRKLFALASNAMHISTEKEKAKEKGKGRADFLKRSLQTIISLTSIIRSMQRVSKFHPASLKSANILLTKMVQATSQEDLDNVLKSEQLKLFGVDPEDGATFRKNLDKYCEEKRDGGALTRYATLLLNLNDPKLDAINESFRKYVHAAISPDPQDFRNLRYDTTASEHLRILTAGSAPGEEPPFFTEWKKTIRDCDAVEKFEDKFKIWTVVDSDDSEDTFLADTEVPNCMIVNGSAVDQRTPALLAYPLEGKYRVLAVKNKNTGKMVADRMMILLIDEKTRKPVIYLTHVYGNPDPELRTAIIELAKKKARRMGCPLVTRVKEEAQMYAQKAGKKAVPYPNTILSLEGQTPYEYNDEIEFTNGAYKMGGTYYL